MFVKFDDPKIPSSYKVTEYDSPIHGIGITKDAIYLRYNNRCIYKQELTESHGCIIICGRMFNTFAFIDVGNLNRCSIEHSFGLTELSAEISCIIDIYDSLIKEFNAIGLTVTPVCDNCVFLYPIVSKDMGCVVNNTTLFVINDQKTLIVQVYGLTVGEYDLINPLTPELLASITKSINCKAHTIIQQVIPVYSRPFKSAAKIN